MSRQKVKKVWKNIWLLYKFVYNVYVLIKKDFLKKFLQKIRQNHYISLFNILR